MTDYTRLFPELPEQARCWIYITERPLSDDEQRAFLDTLQPFLDEWTSHGRPVQGAATVRDGRFVIVAGCLLSADISGCGIDASAQAVEAAAHPLGIAWQSPLLVFYRDADGVVQQATRSAFRTFVESGDVTAATPVFDLSITTLGQLRGGMFEKPAGQSWHARVFRIPEPA